MAIDIGRREFIITFGGAAAAWPFTAGAQTYPTRPVYTQRLLHAFK